jgi:hypothetical protein
MECVSLSHVPLLAVVAGYAFPPCGRYVYNCHTPELNPGYTDEELKFLTMAELQAYDLPESACHSIEQQNLQLFTRIIGWSSIMWLALLSMLVILAKITVAVMHCCCGGGTGGGGDNSDRYNPDVWGFIILN